MDIRGKTVLVAGGTSGLGEGVARHFSARGANVVIVGRRGALAARIADDLGVNALGIGADIGDAEAVAAVVAATLDRFGTIDVNVNTAGILAPVVLVTEAGRPSDTTVLTRLVSTNLIGTFNVMSHAAAVMLGNAPDEDGERGVIINTSSVAAREATTGLIGYAATKAAIEGMTLPAAREFAGRGIRVNTIVPGGFDTPMVDDYVDEDTKAEGVRQFLNPRRLGTPDEFAAFAAHIVENRYFNAASPRLDAGYRMPP
ncbi:SDR family NAD(P)-dependent oxidoreductase [Microbispora sp. H10670]|uniref:SDR family NAD(P)-dependent oxidoreductase n=1 Tax=Microbispora sp. H10670 TaxID=2729108 RepID=UPI001603CB72|nr:SDR family NAD(P)-dependent oxidoreductase [Microbispora sp. H10670]